MCPPASATVLSAADSSESRRQNDGFSTLAARSRVVHAERAWFRNHLARMYFAQTENLTPMQRNNQCYCNRVFVVVTSSHVSGARSCLVRWCPFVCVVCAGLGHGALLGERRSTLNDWSLASGGGLEPRRSGSVTRRVGTWIYISQSVSLRSDSHLTA